MRQGNGTRTHHDRLDQGGRGGNTDAENPFVSVFPPWLLPLRPHPGARHPTVALRSGFDRSNGLAYHRQGTIRLKDDPEVGDRSSNGAKAMTWWRGIGWVRVVVGASLVVGASQTGCNQPTPSVSKGATRFDGTKLVVGVVGDPALLKSVAAQRGEWVARTGSDLVLRDAPVDPRSVAPDVDILLFSGERMGDLIDHQALAVLPNALVAPTERPIASDPESTQSQPQPPEDTFGFADVAPAFRDQVSKYGPDRMGLPIGGSALVIAFRRVAFENPSLVEEARQAGLTLKPPETWDQFDALARFFQGKEINGDEHPDYGVALAWGDDSAGVGNATFLARAAASALHPDQFSFLLDSETTEPRVTSPPFVESLQALVALKEAGPPEASGFDANAARAAFRSGRVALLVDRAEMASAWGTGKSPIGVAPLPGSPRVFDPSRGVWENRSSANRPSYLPSGGGWLVGVAARTTHKEAAEAFARYLAGPESTQRLRSERDFPMLAVRAQQLTQGLVNPRSAPGVEARPWADAVSRTLTADKVVPGLRIPDAPGYLADLTTARIAALHGQSAEEALKTLNDAWARRTRSLGSLQQTWHHRRSLNGPTTAPEPPARP